MNTILSHIGRAFAKRLSRDARTNSVQKNILGSFLLKGISIFCSLLIIPLTMGYVNAKLYGIWLTLVSMLQWVDFFDVGFTLGLKNRLAESLSKEDYKRGKALVSTTYAMLSLIFIPLGILLFLLSPLVSWSSLLHIDPVYDQEIIDTISVLVVFACLNMIVKALFSVVSAFQKVALSSLLKVISQIISLIVIFIMTRTVRPSLVNLAYAVTLVSLVVTVVASVVLYCNQFRKVSPSIWTIEKKYVKDIFNLGFRFFLIQIEVVVLFQTTNFLISNISGPEVVTVYNVAYKYLSLSLMVLNIIMAPLWPAFTDAYTRKDFGWMNMINRKLTTMYGYVVLAIIFMVIASPWVYVIWIGHKVEVPFTMTAVIGVYMIVNTWCVIKLNGINGIGAVKLQSIVAVVSMIVHIPLSYFLATLVGEYGVIVSLLIITTIHAIIYSIQTRKIFGGSADGIWLK